MQHRLSQNIDFLLLSLADHHSEQLQIYWESDREGLIVRLVHALRIPLPPKRSEDEEVRTTSLVRELLELSGGRVDCQQHVFSDECTADGNAELLASLFGITTREFGNVNVQDMVRLVSSSPLFSQSTMSVRDLVDQIVRMRRSLRLGFEEGHLVKRLDIGNDSILTCPESSVAGAERIQL